MYLLDTNAISDAMSDHPKMTARLAGITAQIHTSVIAQGEIYFGIERLPPGKRKTQLAQKASQVLSILPAEPITDPIATVYASLRVQAEAMGLNLDDNDLWIASSAHYLRAVLVSRDKNLARVPNLQVEDWTA